MKKNAKSAVAVFVLVGMFGFMSPTTTHAATSPTLGDAASFSVLAKTLISSIPISSISGDVGLDNAGTNYSGLTSLEVGGIIFDTNGTGPDAVAGNNPALMTSARNDNIAAYAGLSAAPNVACDTDYGAVTQDLVGLSLVPGVYCADAFELSGTLTLDDTAAPGGVWIFRSAATLITSAGSVADVVFATDVASACNVWWGVGSSATLGTGTDFIGNILALTSISMDTGATLDGRAFAQNGAVTLDSNTISGCATPLVSPVLTLDKIIDGGSEAESEWTLSATGPIVVTGPGAAGSTDVVSGALLPVGAYTLSESSGPSSYDASSWSCVLNGGAPATGDTITLDYGDTAVCTITNTYNAPSSSGSRPRVTPSVVVPEETVVPIVAVITPTSVAPVLVPSFPATGNGPSMVLPGILALVLSGSSVLMFVYKKREEHK